VWKATPSFTGKLLYGTAFRAPTLLELYLNNPVLGMGKSDLKPETIQTVELAGDWLATSNLHLALNLFHYQIKDKIGFPGGQIQYANYGEWKGNGFEWEARWKFSPHTALLFNYAYQDSKDEVDNPIADALQQAAYVRLDWMFRPNWFLDINARWVADRPRASNDWRSAMKDYVLTDLTLRHKNLASRWNFAVGVRNLFDEDAREPTTVNIGVTHDLPLPKREFFAEIRYKF
jgi:iron complex outermembrane receptor protein